MASDFDKELDATKAAIKALEPLSPEGRNRAMQYIAQALEMTAPVQGWGVPNTGELTGGGGAGGNGFTGQTPTPKEFMAAKKPKTDVERIACLAFYLTRYGEKPHFKTADLTTLNTEAQLSKIGNPAQASKNATLQNQFLAPVGKGKRQITIRGEALVKALPDREAVNAALAEYPMTRRRARRGAAKRGGK